MRSAQFRLAIAFVLGLTFSAVEKVQAQVTQDFINQAQADYQTIDNYVNSQFAKSLGFYTTLGWNTPPGVFDILTGPRVELGIGAGADFMTLNSLKNLNLGAVNVSSNFSLPSSVPLPFPVITGRVGLMNGLDLGLKLNYLPLVSLPDVGFAANFFGWGLDLRYKILDGIYVPTVTVGVSWDDMQGSFSLVTNINQSSTYVDPNTSTSHSISVSGTNHYTLNWDTKSFGAKLEVGKDLGVAFPFAAIGFQRNSGNVSSVFAGNGSFTVDGGGSTPINLLALNNASPVYFEPKFVVGLDFGAGLHWAVVGESNGTDIAGSTSFRVQF